MCSNNTFLSLCYWYKTWCNVCQICLMIPSSRCALSVTLTQVQTATTVEAIDVFFLNVSSDASTDKNIFNFTAKPPCLNYSSSHDWLYSSDLNIHTNLLISKCLDFLQWWGTDLIRPCTLFPFHEQKRKAAGWGFGEILFFGKLDVTSILRLRLPCAE